MILVNGNRILKNNTTVKQNSAGMSLNTNQLSFPKYRFATSNGSIRFSFSEPVEMIVVWGDGTQQVIASHFSDGYERIAIVDKAPSGVNLTSWETPAHIYTDGITSHTVKLFYPTDKLRGFSMNAQIISRQNFAFGFAEHFNLEAFDLNQVGGGGGFGAFINLDLDNTLFLTKFYHLGISASFYTSSPYYGAVPEELLALPLLKHLDVGDRGFANKSYDNSNLNKIVLAKATLEELFVFGDNFAFEDTAPDSTNPAYPMPDNGALPQNFADLRGVKTLNVTYTKHKSPPAIINSMPIIEVLGFTGCDEMTGWGNLVNLAKLTTLTVNKCNKLPVTVPTYFSSFTLLKTLNMQSVFTAPSSSSYRVGALDTWITNLYTFVVDIASMSGSGQWRQVTFRVNATNDNTADIPSGIEQKPTGYVQGSNNGTPASSRERIWVLKNQYGWTVNYET